LGKNENWVRFDFSQLCAKNSTNYLDLEKQTYVREKVTRAVKKITAPRPIWTSCMALPLQELERPQMGLVCE